MWNTPYSLSYASLLGLILTEIFPMSTLTSLLAVLLVQAAMACVTRRLNRLKLLGSEVGPRVSTSSSQLEVEAGMEVEPSRVMVLSLQEELMDVI